MQSEEFKLIRVRHLDEELAHTIQNCIKYTSARFELIDKLIKSLVPLVDEVPTHHGNTVLMFKLLANFTKMKGYVTNDKITKIPVPVKRNDGTEVYVDMLNPNQMEKLEGLEQEIFLLFHVYFLIDLLVELYMNPKSAEKISSIPLEGLQKILFNEIWIAFNGLLIKSMYQKYHRAGELDKFASEFISSLSVVVKEDMQNSSELCFPFGFRGHSMYLNIIKFDNDQILLRIDDVGKMSKNFHGFNKGKVYPYKLGIIHLNELSKYERYISRLCQIKFEEIDLNNANQVIAKAKEIYTHSIQSKAEIAEMGYPELTQLTIGNCVVENYFVGVYYRLDDILNTGALKIFSWLKNTEEAFIPKETGRESWFAKSKRLRDQELEKELGKISTDFCEAGKPNGSIIAGVIGKVTNLKADILDAEAVKGPNKLESVLSGISDNKTIIAGIYNADFSGSSIRHVTALGVSSSSNEDDKSSREQQSKKALEEMRRQQDQRTKQIQKSIGDTVSDDDSSEVLPLDGISYQKE